MYDETRPLQPPTAPCPHCGSKQFILWQGAADLKQQAISCAERDLSLTEVYRADEVFCTGTMGELAAVAKVDGRTIGDGQPGPMTRRLSEAFTERTRIEGVQVV